MNIKDKQWWKEFYYSDIFILEKNKFQVPTGIYVPKKDLIKGKIPRITVTSLCNGIDNFYNPVIKKNASNFISISFLGKAFYHPYSTSVDMKVHILQLKNKTLNKYIALFLVSLINKQTKHYSYGNQLSSTDIPNKKILLPVNSNNEPDYEFMEEYMREKEIKLQEQYKKYIQSHLSKKPIKLTQYPKWKSFSINELFKIEKCKCSKVTGINKGNIAYIGATNKNNGVLKFIQKQDSLLTKGNCIVFICDGDGSIGYSIYKKEDFIGSTTLKVGRNESLNKYNAMFITTIADQARDKYSFGFKRNEEHLKQEKIMLPVTSLGQPDYEYMANYIKYIEYEKIKEYLNYIAK